MAPEQLSVQETKEQEEPDQTAGEESEEGENAKEDAADDSASDAADEKENESAEKIGRFPLPRILLSMI